MIQRMHHSNGISDVQISIYTNWLTLVIEFTTEDCENLAIHHEVTIFTLKVMLEASSMQSHWLSDTGGETDQGVRQL